MLVSFLGTVLCMFLFWAQSALELGKKTSSRCYVTGVNLVFKSECFLDPDLKVAYRIRAEGTRPPLFILACQATHRGSLERALL
jgi:hypothetical protein